MVDPIKVKNYFNENSESWVKDAYKHAGCNYLTPFHRVRVVKNIIKKLENIQSLLDVGCGAGHLALSIADLGIHVRGIDQNEKMIQQSQTTNPFPDWDLEDSSKRIQKSEAKWAIFKISLLKILNNLNDIPMLIKTEISIQ